MPRTSAGATFWPTRRALPNRSRREHMAASVVSAFVASSFGHPSNSMPQFGAPSRITWNSSTRPEAMPQEKRRGVILAHRRAVPPVVRSGTRSCSQRGGRGCSISSRRPAMTESPANRSRMGPKKPAAHEPLHTLHGTRDPAGSVVRVHGGAGCIVVLEVGWYCPQRSRC
jgi:hypothetical protein